MGNQEKIMDYRVYEEDNLVVISTNARIYEKPLSDLEGFLSSFLKVDKPSKPVEIKPMVSKPIPNHFLQKQPQNMEQQQGLEVSNVPAVLNTRQVDAPVIKEVKDALLDSIRLLRQDKSFVGQATAINETAKTVIDLAKTELMALKIQNELNRR